MIMGVNNIGVLRRNQNNEYIQQNPNIVYEIESVFEIKIFL